MKQMAGFMANSFIHLRINMVFGVYLKNSFGKMKIQAYNNC